MTEYEELASVVNALGRSLADRYGFQWNDVPTDVKGVANAWLFGDYPFSDCYVSSDSSSEHDDKQGLHK